MSEFTHLSCADAQQMLAAQTVNIVDIRDAQSFHAGAIKGALHLTNENLESFLQTADKSLATIVCCYHGNSSQNAAQFLASQAFDKVYSLDGGFEQWRLQYPTDCQ
jgi:thiosulfate sulfurtransferase